VLSRQGNVQGNLIVDTSRRRGAKSAAAKQVLFAPRKRAARPRGFRRAEVFDRAGQPRYIFSSCAKLG
jgi:hypothetical protein